MKSITLFAMAAAAVKGVQVRYDPGYDKSSRSLKAVACSDGENGLITRYGWQTQGDVPGFPDIGASDMIASWNSPACGQCLVISYNGRGTTFLAIDHADIGLVVSQTTMDYLTRNQSVAFGVIDAEVHKTAASACGIHRV